MSLDMSRRIVLFMFGATAIPSMAAQRDFGGPQERDPRRFPPDKEARPMDRKQQQRLLTFYLERMRKDAAELAGLAASIQEDLEKVTENELPLRLVNKAEQVEKLAKRIKNTAKGF